MVHEDLSKVVKLSMWYVFFMSFSSIHAMGFDVINVFAF